MGRVAVVTGGTRGIGARVAVELKEAGHKVAATYAGNEERAREFSEKNGIPAYKFDVGSFEECQKGFAQIAEDLGGPIEILINRSIGICIFLKKICPTQPAHQPVHSQVSFSVS